MAENRNTTRFFNSYRFDLSETCGINLTNTCDGDDCVRPEIFEVIVKPRIKRFLEKWDLLDFSIEFNIRLHDLPEGKSIFVVNQTNSTNATYPITEYPYWWIRIYNFFGEYFLEFTFRENATKYILYDWRITDFVVIGKWQHYVFNALDSTIMEYFRAELYIDNCLVDNGEFHDCCSVVAATFTTSMDILYNRPLLIGGLLLTGNYLAFNARFFSSINNYDISHVKLYNQKISRADVTMLYRYRGGNPNYYPSVWIHLHHRNTSVLADLMDWETQPVIRSSQLLTKWNCGIGCMPGNIPERLTCPGWVTTCDCARSEILNNGLDNLIVVNSKDRFEFDFYDLFNFNTLNSEAISDLMNTFNFYDYNEYTVLSENYDCLDKIHVTFSNINYRSMFLYSQFKNDFNNRNYGVAHLIRWIDANNDETFINRCKANNYGNTASVPSISTKNRDGSYSFDIIVESFPNNCPYPIVENTVHPDQKAGFKTAVRLNGINQYLSTDYWAGKVRPNTYTIIMFFRPEQKKKNAVMEYNTLEPTDTVLPKPTIFFEGDDKVNYQNTSLDWYSFTQRDSSIQKKFNMYSSHKTNGAINTAIPLGLVTNQLYRLVEDFWKESDDSNKYGSGAWYMLELKFVKVGNRYDINHHIYSNGVSNDQFGFVVPLAPNFLEKLLIGGSPYTMGPLINYILYPNATLTGNALYQNYWDGCIGDIFILNNTLTTQQGVCMNSHLYGSQQSKDLIDLLKKNNNILNWWSFDDYRDNKTETSTNPLPTNTVTSDVYCRITNHPLTLNNFGDRIIYKTDAFVRSYEPNINRKRYGFHFVQPYNIFSQANIFTKYFINTKRKFLETKAYTVLSTVRLMWNKEMSSYNADYETGGNDFTYAQGRKFTLFGLFRNGVIASTQNTSTQYLCEVGIEYTGTTRKMYFKVGDRYITDNNIINNANSCPAFDLIEHFFNRDLTVCFMVDNVTKKFGFHVYCRPLTLVNFLSTPIDYNGYVVNQHPFTVTTAPRTGVGYTCITTNNNPGFKTWGSYLGFGSTTPYEDGTVCANIEITQNVWYVLYNAQLYDRYLSDQEILSYHFATKPELFKTDSQTMNLIPDLYENGYPYNVNQIKSLVGDNADIRGASAAGPNIDNMLSSTTTYNCFANTQYWVCD